MKTAGIIGGLGPETTSEFYLEVIFSSFEKDRVKRPPLLIWSVPLPYKAEEEFITKSKNGEEYAPYLKDAAKRLEKGGADFIVIPCNSVHIFIDKIRKSVNIPVLSIVDETIDFLRNNKINEVGILATSATIRQELYKDKLLKNGIAIQKPDDADQDKVANIINNLVHNRDNKKDKKELMKIINKFTDKNINTLLLACTDLQLMVPKINNIKVYDTMRILAHATVREILEK